jgi:hypothetical protein
MRHLFSKSITQADASTLIPVEYTIRWQRQMVTDEVDLSEAEKDSDRNKADRFLALLPDYAALAAENAKLKQERDLAIAHDRQPYPTAHAYEQVCKALEGTKQEQKRRVP